jgi:hypothetical protein
MLSLWPDMPLYQRLPHGNHERSKVVGRQQSKQTENTYPGMSIYTHPRRGGVDTEAEETEVAIVTTQGKALARSELSLQKD